MVIDTLKTNIEGVDVTAKFPNNRRSVLVYGGAAEDVSFLIKALLGHDFTTCYNYGATTLALSNGSKIIGSDSRIHIDGQLPKIRCLSFSITKGIQSFIVSDELECKVLRHNLTHYSTVMEDVRWEKVCRFTNMILGCKYVQMQNRQLIFDDSMVSGVSLSTAQDIYLLVADCMLTSGDYEQVVLIEDTRDIDEAMQLRFMDTLGKLRSTYVLCFAQNNVFQIDDIPLDTGVGILYV